MAIGNKSVTSVKVRVIADVGGCERETSDCRRPRSNIYNTSLQLVTHQLRLATYIFTYIHPRLSFNLCGMSVLVFGLPLP